MASRRAMARQANALFKAAQADGAADRVGQELGAFVEYLTANPDAARLLTHPALPVPRKVAVIAEIAARAGFGPMMSRLLALLAGQDALGQVEALATAYQVRLDQHHRISTAEVTTATPLDEAARDALARGFGALTGGTVRIEARVDPSILGGAVARIGSTVYDGSVTGQLARLRATLVENV